MTQYTEAPKIFAKFLVDKEFSHPTESHTHTHIHTHIYMFNLHLCVYVHSESLYTNMCVYIYIWSFPGGSDCKKSVCNAGDLGSIPGLRRSPGGRHGNPLQCSCLENPHGQRSLGGCSLWGRKELDTTERLNGNHLCPS